MTRTISAAVFACALTLGVCSEHLTAQTGGAAAAQEQKVSISGPVANPGAYDVKPGMTVGQAIAQAGGMTPKAGGSRILLTRLAYGKLKTTSVKPGHRVQPGDKIVVESKQ
jgi:polysaccharide export outer membrane protein